MTKLSKYVIIVALAGVLVLSFGRECRNFNAKEWNMERARLWLSVRWQEGGPTMKESWYDNAGDERRKM